MVYRALYFHIAHDWNEIHCPIFLDAHSYRDCPVSDIREHATWLYSTAHPSYLCSDALFVINSARSCCDKHSAGQEHPRAARFALRYDLRHFMPVRTTTVSLTGAAVIAVRL